MKPKPITINGNTRLSIVRSKNPDDVWKWKVRVTVPVGFRTWFDGSFYLSAENDKHLRQALAWYRVALKWIKAQGKRKP